MSTRTRLAAKTAQAAAATTAKRAAGAAAGTSALPIRLFADAGAWEAWLEANHAGAAGVWLKIGKKGGGAAAASVTYEEALDAALCFGWIDGQRRRHDAGHFLQKFTPRRRHSVWSRRNADRAAALAVAGRMRAAGQAEVDAAKADGRWERAYAPPSAITVPADFQAALDRDEKARAFFEGLGKTKRYSFLWRIETARREETRKRRIEQFVELLAQGKTL